MLITFYLFWLDRYIYTHTYTYIYIVYILFTAGADRARKNEKNDFHSVLVFSFIGFAYK